MTEFVFLRKADALRSGRQPNWSAALIIFSLVIGEIRDPGLNAADTVEGEVPASLATVRIVTCFDTSSLSLSDAQKVI